MALALLPVQELWDRILDHLHDSTPALNAVALANSAFTRHAQSLLFETVVVPAEPLACDFYVEECEYEIEGYLARVQRLTGGLLACPDAFLLSRIRVLDIHSSSAAILHLLAGVPFTHVDTLRLLGVPQAPDVVEDLAALVAIPSLEEVEMRFMPGFGYRFSDVQLRTVFGALAPGVRVLKLSSCHPYRFLPPSSRTQQTRAHLRPQLRKLELTHSAWLFPLLFNDAPFDFSRLESISLTNSWGDGVDEFLLLAGENAEELYVDELDKMVALTAIEMLPCLERLVCSNIDDGEVVTAILAGRGITLETNAPSKRYLY
ncbi:hypothetical protein MKEN_00161300 [Mycena kentingensis (nom. inval.)]|nr:hypothetical protein MKEN_00161300 [Mycena kentingensis (nom. inval.)]